MSPNNIIKPNPVIPKDLWDDSPHLNISEFFYDTIQGEGVTAGCPAAFLRLQGCMLSCSYVDTKAIRDNGSPYTFDELFNFITEVDLIDKFRNGHHLVLTGGSPLLQQAALTNFIEEFAESYGFKPFIELENECTIHPNPDFVPLVDVWNNSPKLCNSGNVWQNRFRPDVIKFLSDREDSWFKFVVYQESDWEEIETDFIKSQLIRRDQVILMPRGENRKELAKNRMFVVNLAIQNNVRYCTREQIVLWNDKKGV